MRPLVNVNSATCTQRMNQRRGTIVRTTKYFSCRMVVICTLLLLHLALVWNMLHSPARNRPKASYQASGTQRKINREAPRIRRPSDFSNYGYTHPNSHTPYLMGTPVGWDSTPKGWIQRLCPEVIDHYNDFPSFSKIVYFYMNKKVPIPVQTTAHAAQTVCILKVLNIVASSLNVTTYLHAGSHLGAVLHGQSIPWDDDVDVFFPHEKRDQLLRVCGQGKGLELETGVFLKCLIGHNGLKAWIQDPEMTKVTQSEVEWFSPFVDIFMYRRNDTFIFETYANGTEQKESYPIRDYFPTRPYYFGGVYLQGPSSEIARTRYDVNRCVVGTYNHRLELWYWRLDGDVDCRQLRTKFPFVDGHDKIEMGNKSRFVFPSRAVTLDTALSAGTLPADWIDSDQTISKNHSCSTRDNIEVVTYDANGGQRWMDAVLLLKDAGVILVHNMDLMVNRTGWQHTARLMAYHLKMNYVWAASGRGASSRGGTGRVILSRCNLERPKVLRDKSGTGNSFLTQIATGDSSVVTIGFVNHEFVPSEFHSYMGDSRDVILMTDEIETCQAVKVHTHRNVSRAVDQRAICTNLGGLANLKRVEPVIDYGFASVVVSNTHLTRVRLTTTKR